MAAVCTVDVLEVEDVDDAIDDDEFVRCSDFFCGINMRETSSALIDANVPAFGLEAFHPNLDMGWKLGGEATTVVIGTAGWITFHSERQYL